MYEKLRTKTPRKRSSFSLFKATQARLSVVRVDQCKAEIMTYETDQWVKTSIHSDQLNKHRASGGSRSKMPFRKQSIYSELNENHYREEQQKRFFKEILKSQEANERVLIIGPGTTKDQLWRYLNKIPSMKEKVETPLVKTGKLTHAQLLHHAREYYGKE